MLQWKLFVKKDNMKPILYYRVDENNIPFDNFCSDAAIGANEVGISCIAFSDIKQVPKNPYNIVVTSVEESIEWFGYKIFPINDTWAGEFKKRKEQFCSLDEIESYPCFIKPAQDIKAFTGIIVENEKEARLFTNNYSGILSVQEIVEIESEYRLYYTEARGVIGIKHYLGNPYLVPDEEFVNTLVNRAKKELKEKSFTLDIGIKDNGETFLIEVNDGWSIGNYGLSPSLYYSFIKARWLQLTGVIK